MSIFGIFTLLLNNLNKFMSSEIWHNTKKKKNQANSNGHPQKFNFHLFSNKTIWNINELLVTRGRYWSSHLSKLWPKGISLNGSSVLLLPLIQRKNFVWIEYESGFYATFFPVHKPQKSKIDFLGKSCNQTLKLILWLLPPDRQKNAKCPWCKLSGPTWSSW